MIRRTDLNAQTVGPAAFVQVTLASGTTINQDAARFAEGSGDADATEVLLEGRYGFFAKVRWEPQFTGITHLAIGTGGPWTWWPSVSFQFPTDGDDVGQVAFIYLESDLPGGTSSFDLRVRQESGVNQTLLEAMFQITYLGPFTDMGTDFDDF